MNKILSRLVIVTLVGMSFSALGKDAFSGVRNYILKNKNNYEVNKVFGDTLTLKKPIGSEITDLSLYSKLTKTIQGNQKCYVKEFSAIVSNGISYSCSNGVISIVGTATGYSTTTSITGRYGVHRVDLPTDAGTYTFSVNSSGLTPTLNGAVILRRVNDRGELIETPIGLTNGNTYTLDGTDGFVGFIYVISSGTVDGTISVMVNKGSTELPFETFNPTLLLDFSAKNDVILNIGGASSTNTIPQSYGLAVIPIEDITGNTKRNEFTYSDDSKGVFIADSISVLGTDIYYTQRIAKTIFSTGDTVAEPYLSDNVLGLVDGAIVYYELSKPLVYKIGDFPKYILKDGLAIWNDLDAYMTCEYFMTKNIKEPIQMISLGKVGYNAAPSLGINRNMRAVAYEKNITYCGGYNGNIWRIEEVNGYYTITHNSVLYADNLVTGIAVDGDYLYVCDRDPSAGGAVSSAIKGHSYVLNKADLSLVWTGTLSNKGTDCRVFKNHLYIMEQIGHFQIYDITNPILPNLVFTEANNAGGEYQRVDFWDDGGTHYAVMTGFEVGVTFYNVTNPSIPVKIGRFELNMLKGRQGLMQIFDGVVDFPYYYCTIGASHSEAKFTNNVMNGLITLDITNPAIYADETIVDDPTKYSVSQIPHSGTPEHGNEADLNPSRMTKLNDLIITNNSSLGTAIFRVVNNIPVYQGSYKITGKDAIPMAMVATDNDRIIMVNGDGTASAQNGIFFFRAAGIISDNQ